MKKSLETSKTSKKILRQHSTFADLFEAEADLTRVVVEDVAFLEVFEAEDINIQWHHLPLDA
jgi:hypothetical protein